MDTEKVVTICATLFACVLCLSVSQCQPKIDMIIKDCITGAKTDVQAMLCTKSGN